MKRTRNEIKKIIYAVITLIIIIAIISQGIVFSVLLHITNSQKQKVVEAVAGQIETTVIEKLSVVEKICNKLYHNSDIAMLLTSNDDNSKKHYLRKIADYIDALQLGNEDLIYAVAFGMEGNGHKLTNNMTENEFIRLSKVYEEYIKAQENGMLREDGIYCDFFLQDSYGNGELYVCSVDKVQQYNFEELNQDTYGTLIVCNKINAKKLLLEMEDLNFVNIEIKNNYNQQKNSIVLSNTNKKPAFQTNVFQKVEVLNTQWDMEIVIAANEVMSAIEILQMVLLSETVLLLFLILVLRVILKKGVLQPIDKIILYLSNYAPVKKQERLESGGLYEIQCICDSINYMVQNTKDIMHQLIHNQQSLYEAEIRNNEKDFYALQSQVNPHFLCNALECMRGMALESGLIDVADMSADISEIMRYVLQKKEIEAIINEINITEKYIRVMKNRYPNSFRYEFLIQDELKNVNITRMSIQPLVENSFLHGRFFKKKNALLRIKAYSENEKAYICIYDNGLGFSQDKLESVNRKLEMGEEEESDKRGIGLININQRIKYQYGNEYGLSINSKEGEYTEIVLSFPLKKF